MKKNESLKYNQISKIVFNYMTNGTIADGYKLYQQLLDSKKQEWQENEEDTLADIVYKIIYDEIMEFYAGGVMVSEIDDCEMAMELIIGAEKEWFDLPCDPEGATPEQDAVMEEFLNKLINDVSDVMEMDLITKDSVGALYTYNADAKIVENEEESQEIVKFIKQCPNHKILTAESGEDFETACAKLDLQSNQTEQIHEYWMDNGNHLTICYDWR